MKNIIREIKKPFFGLLVLFFVCIWLGYLSGANNPKEAKVLFEKLYHSFSSLQGVNVFALFFFIFINNAIKSFAVVLLGAFFGIIPVLFVAINGILIGLMSSVVILQHGANYLFAGTIPHGILEIPAFLISASYGIQLGRRYYRKVRYHEPFKPFLVRAIGKTIRYVFPMLLVASFIETFITMTILRSL